MEGVSLCKIGQVTDAMTLQVWTDGETILDSPIGELKEAWQSPLDWS